jgi:hypothetical protein
MKSVRLTAVMALFALLLPLSAFAKDNNKGKMNLSSNAQIAGTQLQAGDYTVEWSGTGPAAQVSFLRNGKTVATTQGNVVQLKDRAPYDQVVISTNNGQNVIQEIDFGKKTTALRFGEGVQQSGQ